MKRLLDFVIVFVVTLVAGIGVTFLWNLIGHHRGIVEWKTAFTLAIIMSIVLTWMQAREGKSKQQ